MSTSEKQERGVYILGKKLEIGIISYCEERENLYSKESIKPTQQTKHIPFLT